MNKEFIPYEQSLELKELGFDEYCFAYYNKIGFHFLKLKNSDVLLESEHIKGNWATAPLYQQAFRWFREKYGLYIDLFVDDDNTFGFFITHFTDDARVDSPIYRTKNTYEEAELACLKKLIEIAKNQ